MPGIDAAGIDEFERRHERRGGDRAEQRALLHRPAAPAQDADQPADRERPERQGEAHEPLGIGVRIGIGEAEARHQGPVIGMAVADIDQVGKERVEELHVVGDPPLAARDHRPVDQREREQSDHQAEHGAAEDAERVPASQRGAEIRDRNKGENARDASHEQEEPGDDIARRRQQSGEHARGDGPARPHPREAPVHEQQDQRQHRHPDHLPVAELDRERVGEGEREPAHRRRP